MEINFTITYTAQFDEEQAEEDFRAILWGNPHADPDKALYDAVEENLSWPHCVDDCPNEVVETAATALRKRIGGIQMQMDLPPFPTLWWEDSVWKK